MLLCILFLTGCSQPVPTREAEREQRDTPKDEAPKNDAFTPETTEENSAERILARLIGDEGFRACVWQDAGIESEDTQEMILHRLNQCEELVLKEPAGDGSLHSLEDLSYLPNLKSLVIDLDAWESSAPADLTPIAGLSRLKRLCIENHTKEETDLSFLAEMKQVTELDLQNCGIREIRFLSELTELRSINLNDNLITDLTPLTGLTKLERLELAENHIRDISPLVSLTNLFDVSLDGNEISDISALSDLPHLNQAGLSDNRISDMSPLAGKQELMFASVFGNPCTDLQPVWEVPLLSWNSGGASTEKTEYAEEWIRKNHPDVTEYACIDYVEGDLNRDGRQDIAFVIDGTFGDKKFDDLYAETRRLYVLIQQKDGSMQEINEVPYVNGKDAGGMRGDPYFGIFMGDGYLMLKEGGGSSTGTTATQIYGYRNGKLEQTKNISVGDSQFADGYDVIVTDMENDTWYAYAIAMDGFRMVRVDLANAEYPFHKAFPRMNLYDVSYCIYDEKTDTNITAWEALDQFINTVDGNGEQADLPYAVWQKTGYELLKGVELPGYYYTVPGTEEVSQEGTGSEIQTNTWEGDFIYYDGLTDRDGQLYHVICYRTKKENTVYLLNDDTGEIQAE